MIRACLEFQFSHGSVQFAVELMGNYSQCRWSLRFGQFRVQSETWSSWSVRGQLQSVESYLFVSEHSGVRRDVHTFILGK